MSDQGAAAVETAPRELEHDAHATEIEPIEPLPFELEERATTTPSVCVVIPVYNEEQVLPTTYDATARALDGLGARWSLLFVNDGSRDRTGLVLESLARRDRRVSYIVLSRNFGHQAALTAGLDHATGDVVITMDGDLQHPPELIPDLIAAWRRGYDIVHTRKLLTEDLPRGRGLATRLAYHLTSRVAQVDIIPHASDYRLFDRNALEAVRALPERSRLYRGIAPWVGFRQAVIPFVAARRSAGASQYGFRQLASLFARSFFDFSNAPLHIGLLLGGIATALAGLYLLFVIVALAAGQSIPRGFASVIAVVVILGSIQLMFSGILGVYIARIYNEVRARPVYVMSRLRRGEAEVPEDAD